MKSYFKIGSLIIAANFCLSGCYDITTNHLLSITNKSKKEISVLYSNDVQLDSNENNIAYYISDQVVTEPDSSRDIIKVGGKNAWHNYIEDGRTKKLFLYIFSTDTLKKYNNVFSMYSLVNQHKYLKIVSYSENDLNKINWKIVFKM